jgi:uncharacterized repeat protein (TIGR01451 family)
LIGVSADGTTALPNQGHGIQIGSPGSSIGGILPGQGNIIANNGGDGIFITGGARNQIRGNSIFSNSGLGIDLSPNAVTPNDGCDGDGAPNGPNTLQNFPIIGSADSSAGNTTITGVLNSIANQNFVLDFYVNDSCDISGSGEGQTYIGSGTVSTDVSCNGSFGQSFPLALSSSQFVTVTATDANGNTSEFSACKQINSPPTAFVDLAITKTDSHDPIAVGNPLTYTLNVANLSSNTAGGVVVTDTLPSSVTFVSASAGCTHSGGIVTCPIGTIAGGANSIVQITVTPNSTGTISNTASVSTTDADMNSNNNVDTETTAIANALSATLTDSPDPIRIGSDLTYTATVSNASISPATGVQLQQQLPFHVSFVSASPGCSHSSGIVTCDIGIVAGSSSASVQILAIANFAGTVSSSISVNSANLGGASASATTTIVPAIPNASNYTFETATNGSLTDMSSGTTILIGESRNHTRSVVQDIGFDFFFFGDFQPLRYTRFFVNASGVLRLLDPNGLPAESFMESGNHKPLSSPYPTFPAFAPFASLQETSDSGKVHYKIVGTAPNRVLVVEWLNMETHISDVDPRLTYQARLYETTGVIEYVYGSMSMSAAGANDPDSRSAQIGFAADRVAGKFGTVLVPQNGTLTYNGFVNQPFDNIFTASTIASLTSESDGSRRVIRFDPPAPPAPSNLTFSNISATTIQLNWTDNAINETGYVIYSSTDGVNFRFARSIPRNSTSAFFNLLEAGTAYTFRVHAAAESGLVHFAEGSQSTLPPSGHIISTSAGGNWSDPNTWVGGVVPTANQNATIAAGATVIVNVSANVYDLTVDGTLEFSPASSSNVNAHTVAISSGGVFRSPETPNLFPSLSLTGNLINNGILDFSTAGNTTFADITFTGLPDAVFTGTGTVTDVRTIFSNKNLELSVSNFSVRGSTANTTDGFLDISSLVTFKVAGTFTGTHRVYISQFVAGANLWIDNPNFTASFPGSAVTLNHLRMNAGTFSSFTLSARSVAFHGGAVNVGRLINIENYIQSGGTVTLGVGVFNQVLMQSISSLNLSGGLIVIPGEGAGGLKSYDVQPGAVNFTGGTVQFGGNTGDFSTFEIQGVLPNVHIDNTTGAQFVRQVSGTAQVLGNIIIEPGTTLQLRRSSSSIVSDPSFVHKGAVFENNGTLLVQPNNGSLSRFDFGGSIPQLYTGSGTANGLASLGVINTSSGGLTIDTASPQITTGRINLFAGTIHNSHKLTLSGGVQTIQRGAAARSGPAGEFDVPPIFTAGANLVYSHGGDPITMGHEVPPQRFINTLIINAPNGVTMSGGNAEVLSRFDLTNGIFSTGPNTLIVGPSVTVNRTNGYVDGNLRMDFGATGSKTFHIGTSNGYSPVIANATALGTNPSSLTMRAVEGSHPNAPNPSGALKRFWQITETGDLSAVLTFNYLQSDVPPVPESSLELKRYSGTGTFFNTIPASIDTSANTAVTASPVSEFSDWTLLSPLAPTAANASVSGRVITSDGRGVFGALVTITGPNGYVRHAITNPFGYYRLIDVPVGGTYAVGANHKRFVIHGRAVSVMDDIADMILTADPATTPVVQ